MDVLNHLLWLKARLVGRAFASRQTTGLAVIGLVLGVLFAAVMAVAVFLLILREGPVGGRAVVSGLLLSVYGGWLLGPALGYRFNEGLDPSVFAHLPVRGTDLTLGLFLSNFLDPTVLVASPVLLTCGLAGWFLGGNGLWGALGLTLFLFHSMGAAQVVYLWSLAFLRRRRAKEVLFVALSLVLIGGLIAFEVGLLSGADEVAGGARGLELLTERFPWIPALASCTPAGLATEAVMPPGPDAVFGPAYACLLLFVVSALSVWVSAHYTNRILSGSGGAPSAAAAPAATPDRLVAFFKRFTRSPAIAGRAAAECRLILREPQYLLLYIVYPIGYGWACRWAATQRDFTASLKGVIVGFIVLSSVFLFTGVVFNTLAVERAGLKLAYLGSQGPLRYLLGKNLAAWAMLNASYVVVAFAGCFGLGLSWAHFVGLLVAGQVAIVSLIGIGNLGSTLAPMPLPAKGASPRQAATFGRVFTTMVVNSLGMGLVGWAVSMSWGLLFGTSLALKQPVFVGPFLVFALAWVGGMYVLGVYGGALVLRWRRDQLLEVVR